MFVVLLVIDPTSHELGSPAKPGRFRAPGRAKTARNADQTVQALYWAYDGANLIGTPPRLYNQIIRKIAWDRKPNDEKEATAEFVRLFALVNVAMADAGKYAWKEKYQYQLWRPLSGVREHDSGADPGAINVNAKLDPDADPFWQALGAPETNTNKISFKPPFPAYPSGHATFGAACFQMARLFYKKRDSLKFDDNGADNIEFTFVSDELNGINRDLYQPFDPSLPIEEQPGLVRTRVNRRYPSLWHAIFENALSRIYLGVHWHFDAFALTDVEGEPKDPKDAKEGEVCYKDPNNIGYSNVWTAESQERHTYPVGGVPLGLGVANEIWSRWAKRDEEARQGELPEGAPLAEIVPQTEQLLKSSNTNIR